MFVGIDVSKDKLDVHLRPSGQAFTVPRDSESIENLAQHLSGLEPELVVMEATGGFETVVAAGLAATDLPLAIVNPRQIRDFAKAAGRLAKTDTLDAAVIAHFAEAMRPEPRAVPDAASRRLGELVTRRRQLLGMRVSEKNRHSRLADPRALRSLEEVMAVLDEQLDVIDREIASLIHETSAWREKDNLLRSVPGVGPKTAQTLISELPELGQLHRRGITSLSGLAPYPRDSGKMRGRRAIVGGRKAVRSALYMAVMVSIRRDLPLAQTYHRLRAAGKEAKVAITACMRKLIVILNAILRDERPWKYA